MPKSAPSLSADAERLPWSVRLGWAVGSVVTTTLLFITNTFFLRFVTDHVGLTAGTAAAVLALPKLVDILIYPTIGLVSDRTRSGLGRRRPYLLAGGALGSLSLLMMFNVPEALPLGGKTVYVFGALVLGSLANASFNVPYLAMPAEMTTSVGERNILISYRVYVLSASQFIAGGVCPLLIQWFGGGAFAYSVMAAVMAGYLALVAYTCFAATRIAPSTTLASHHKGSFFKTLPTMFASRSYLGLLLCKYTFLTGSTAHTATAAFYVKYVMQAPDSVLALFLLVYSAGMVASQPVWLRVSRRIGKVWCFGIAASVYAVISVAWAVMHPSAPQTLFLVLSFANGLGAGGAVLTSQALVPDAIDDDFRIRGIRREGSLVSMVALAEKAASATGLAVVGAILSYHHYVAPKAGQVLNAEGRDGIAAAFGLAPAAFMILGAAFLLLMRSPPRAAGVAAPVVPETPA